MTGYKNRREKSMNNNFFTMESTMGELMTEPKIIEFINKAMPDVYVRS